MVHFIPSSPQQERKNDVTMMSTSDISQSMEMDMDDMLACLSSSSSFSSTSGPSSSPTSVQSPLPSFATFMRSVSNAAAATTSPSTEGVVKIAARLQMRPTTISTTPLHLFPSFSLMEAEPVFHRQDDDDERMMIVEPNYVHSSKSGSGISIHMSEQYPGQGGRRRTISIDDVPEKLFVPQL